MPTICVRFSAGAAASSPRRWRYLALTGRRATPPYHYVFRSLDGDALARALGGFACGRDEPGHIALDGKTLRGSRRLDAKALHVVSAFATLLSAVVGDLAVAPDENEITAALALLKDLPLEGAIITGDAIFCQREVCQTITDRQGDYLFVVKDNQPALKADIAESFGDLSPPPSPTGAAAAPPPDLATARTIEKGHGRIETRSIAVSAEVVPHLAWPGAAQVARIARERRIGDKISTEVAYLVTSLTAAKAGPERLLHLARAHWGIDDAPRHSRPRNPARAAPRKCGSASIARAQV